MWRRVDVDLLMEVVVCCCWFVGLDVGFLEGFKLCAVCWRMAFVFGLFLGFVHGAVEMEANCPLERDSNIGDISTFHQMSQVMILFIWTPGSYGLGVPIFEKGGGGICILAMSMFLVGRGSLA